MRQDDKVSTDAERFREMCDKEDIREIALLYAQYVIDRRGDLIPLLFTEDGTVDFGAESGPIKGRDALTKFYSVLTDTLGLVANHTIEVRGDDAIGRCAMHSPWYEGSAPGFVGYYRDTYRRVSDLWRFSSRQYKIYRGPESLVSKFRPLW